MQALTILARRIQRRSRDDHRDEPGKKMTRILEMKIKRFSDAKTLKSMDRKRTISIQSFGTKKDFGRGKYRQN